MSNWDACIWQEGCPKGEEKLPLKDHYRVSKTGTRRQEQVTASKGEL
jgi:hypothetical protein